MSEKDLSYRLSADPRQFERGMKSAEASARAFERELAKLERQQAMVEASLAEVGVGVLAAGAAIAAGLVMATRAAMQWETAWTGVAKVVDGSPEQMAMLESELRQLAHTLPQTHQEIAGVAAAAGQLGIAREDIIDFTRVMVNLGTATNLTSEEAAFALSRLMNIMQSAPDDVDRLGATIVELGNNSATTEQEIVDMALRIAGAGKTVRMSEADVLGFSAALSSVGVMAEAGGSAISRAFIAIEDSIRQGGDKLDLFAQVSGKTVDQFKGAWQEDAAQATASFIEGLGRMQASGGDVFATLRQLGLQEILLRDALLRLAGAGDLVSRSLDIANQGWEDGTALLEEAERRYGTVESRIAMAKNSLNDFAIDVGNTFLPAVGEAADLVGDLASAVGDLPGPVKAALAVIGAIAATLLLTGGAALIAVPQIAAYKAAIDTLASSQGRLAAATVAASTAMGRVGSFLAGPWGLAIAGAIALMTTFAVSHAQAKGRARELSDTLDKQSGAVTRDTALWVANELASRGVVEQADKIGISAADLTQAILGQGDAVARVNAVLDEHSKVVAPAYARGDTAEAVQDVRDAFQGLGGDVTASKELFDQLTAGMAGQKTTIAELDPALRQLAVSTGFTAEATTGFAGELDELDKALKAAFSSMFGLEEAEDAAIRAMQTMTEAAKENKGALAGNSEAALTNRANVRAVIEAHMGQIEAYAATGATSEQLRAKTEALRKKFVDQARQAGLSKTEVAKYAKAYDDIPAAISTSIKTPGLPTAHNNVTRFKELWYSIKDRQVRLRAIMASQENPASGMASGGLVDGPPGHDNVHRMLTRGEFVSTTASTAVNRAALEAANAGARLAVVGTQPAMSPSSAGGGGGGLSVAQQAAAIRSALMGVVVQMDGRTVGYITGREADIMRRGG